MKWICTMLMGQLPSIRRGGDVRGPGMAPTEYSVEHNSLGGEEQTVPSDSLVKRRLRDGGSSEDSGLPACDYLTIRFQFVREQRHDRCSAKLDDITPRIIAESGVR